MKFLDAEDFKVDVHTDEPGHVAILVRSPGYAYEVAATALSLDEAKQVRDAMNEAINYIENRNQS